jgi:hypothetical protein
MRVASVRVTVNGSRVVDVEDWRDESTIGIRRPHWGIRHTYAYGMWDWRQRLRDERRVLVEVQP